MTSDRALLANVEIYLAEGNIRRGVSGFANNMLAKSADGEFMERRLTMASGTSNQVTSITGNVATVIRATKPITVTATVAPSSTPTTFTINSIFIYTGELGDLTLANAGPVDSKVSVIQI